MKIYRTNVATTADDMLERVVQFRPTASSLYTLFKAAERYYGNDPAVKGIIAQADESLKQLREGLNGIQDALLSLDEAVELAREAARMLEVEESEAMMDEY